DRRNRRRRALPASLGRPVIGPANRLASRRMASRPRRFLYVMDPLAHVLVDKDTTFAFMLEGQRRGHEQHQCGIEDLFVERTIPPPRVRAATAERAAQPSQLAEQRTAPPTWFDVVFMRKDPPFDLTYYSAPHILGLVDARVTFVLNAPRGLREANEKLYALH